MSMVTMMDIQRRYKSHALSESSNAQTSKMYDNIFKRALDEHSVRDIAYCIENWERLSGSIDYKVANVLALFEILCDVGSSSQIKKYANIITETSLNKVRDAKQTQTYLKRKRSQITTKIQTKINNNIDDMNNHVQNTLNSMKSNLKKNTAAPIQRGRAAAEKTKQMLTPKQQKEKDEAVKESYDKLIKTLAICRDCDRILENYNNLSRRYNIDKLIAENTEINGVSDTVNELCKLVDTYNMPNNIKLNSVLESAWYGMSKNHIVFENKDIINTACDYFLFKEDGIECCSKILASAVIFDDKDDMGDVKFITEEEPEESSFAESIRDYGFFINEESVKPAEKEKETEFNKIFNDFKKSEDSSNEGKLRSLITKLYTKKPEDVVEGTPNLLSYIRYMFILGVAASNPFGPIMSIILLIADYFVKSNAEREETEKMLKCFKAEKSKAEKKLSTIKNSDEKNRLGKYIDTLDDAIEKIDEYYNSLLNDAELDNKYNNTDDNKTKFKDLFSDEDLGDSADDGFGDFDFGDDDDFDLDNFEESLLMVPRLEKAIIRFNEASAGVNLIEIIENRIDSLNYHVLDSLSEFSSRYPDILDTDQYRTILESTLEATRKGHKDIKSDSIKYARISAYSEALIKAIPKSSNNSIKTIYDEYFKFEIATEVYSCMKEIDSLYNNYSPVLEFSFSNSLKLAADKLKKSIVKLSDKEKTVSKNIDVSLNSFTKNVERALTNDNRESVIKGSILPSASRMIKMVLAAGITHLIAGPVVAIIGVLGYLGTSAKFKYKERQLVLDEIEVEKKMVEKYIDIAESKNDMKALKELLLIQKNLDRQYARIKYKMRVDFNQKPFDSKLANEISDR